MTEDVTVRDARPGDVEVVADLADTPRAVATRLLRERRVRVAEREGAVVGLLAYDATRSAVHLTRLAGDVETVAALLAEPVAFARAEDLPVEAVVPEGEAGARDAVAAAGFEDVGDGPRFEGERTRRYRLVVDDP